MHEDGGYDIIQSDVNTCPCPGARGLEQAMIRLDRYLSEGGKFTRREAGEAVRRGLVAVNGETVRDPSRKVDETADRITVEGADFRYTEFRYVKLNKPAGYVSTTDPGERSVMDLVPPEFRRAGAFPCGRLDIDTTGLLLITNDGQLAHELLSPRHHCEKTYRYRCSPVDGEQIRRLEEGLDLGDFTTKPCRIEAEDPEHGSITLTEGKFHQIKRMFLAAGSEILELERTGFAGLTLSGIGRRGDYAELTEEETELLRRAARSQNA